MGLRRTTDASVEPLTTAEAKTHLRIEAAVTEHDTYIDGLVAAARQSIENDLKRALIDQTWVLTLDRWPDRNWIDLPRPELRSVTTVDYVDENGTSQTLSSGDYFVDTASVLGRIVLDDDASWPDLDERPAAITITYQAGYGTTAAEVPAPLVHAVRFLVGHFYEYPNAVIVGTNALVLPMAVSRLIMPYKVYHFGDS